MQNHIILPEPTLRRLPWYLAYVEILKGMGVEYVSSTQISCALNVDSSQIAKDLSFFNLGGKTRIGYEVSTFVDIISDFLGFRRCHKAYIIGAGSLGRALINDDGLSKYGLKIVAGFDVSEEALRRNDVGVPLYNMDQMPEIMEKEPAQIGILTVPAQCAQDAADKAIGSGIKAIWNFTPYRVKVADGIVMANTSIYAHLALIYNRLELSEAAGY